MWRIASRISRLRLWISVHRQVQVHILILFDILKYPNSKMAIQEFIALVNNFETIVHYNTVLALFPGLKKNWKPIVSVATLHSIWLSRHYFLSKKEETRREGQKLNTHLGWVLPWPITCINNWNDCSISSPPCSTTFKMSQNNNIRITLNGPYGICSTNRHDY